MSWMDRFGPGLTPAQRSAKMALAREHDEREARRREAIEAAHDAALVRRIQRADFGAAEEWFVRRCVRERVRIVWVTERPCACSSARWIRIRRIVDWATLEEGKHELAHVLCGPCPRTRPHQPIETDTTISCLACEREAWEVARTLLPAFPRASFKRLKSALSTYRYGTGGTDAPRDERERVDRMLSSRIWAEQEMARMRWQDKEALVRRWLQQSKG